MVTCMRHIKVCHVGTPVQHVCFIAMLGLYTMFAHGHCVSRTALLWPDCTPFIHKVICSRAADQLLLTYCLTHQSGAFPCEWTGSTVNSTHPLLM